MGGGRQGPTALRPGSGSDYTGGAWGGEWHPLKRRRRAVCEDVRRRKKARKPDKASENQYEDCRWRTREKTKDALFSRRRRADGFYPTSQRTVACLYFLKHHSAPCIISNFPFTCQVRTREHWAWLAPQKKLGDEEESLGWTSGWSPELSFSRITHKKSRIFAWHGTTQPVRFGIYPLIRVDASWLWNCKLKKRASRRFFFTALCSWRHSSLGIQFMLSPPLSVHAKTEIYMILILSGKFFLSLHLQFLYNCICQSFGWHVKCDCGSALRFFFCFWWALFSGLQVKIENILQREADLLEEFSPETFKQTTLLKKNFTFLCDLRDFTPFYVHYLHI